MTDAPTRGIGDNKPPLPTPEEIAASLAEKHPKFLARAAEIEAKIANVPEVLATQDESDKASEFVKACMTFDSLAKDTHKDEKAPYLDGGRAVDAFFTNLRARVDAIRTKLKARTTAYDVKVMQEEEARRKEAARLAQEEAEVLAVKAKTDDQRINAQAAEMDARDAAAAVAVKPAEITRTRTATGVTRSLLVTWKFEVIDEKKVPKKFLAPSAAKIDAAIKAATTEDRKCDLVIPGVRIYPDYDSRVR